jgi:rubredoxin-NAD+ reductase
MSKLPVVIVGSGLAGYTLAREFRKLDTDTPVVIVSADHAGFYSKPMLSNAFVQKKSADALLMKTAEQMSVELKAEVFGYSTVTSIDTARKELTVNREMLRFSKLVLALGADPIRIPMQGNGADEVMSVNDLDDYRRFRSATEGKKDIAILGAGLIGCEFANDMVSGGFNVHVIDLSPQLLGRLLPAESAAFMQSKLEATGISFHLATSIQQAERVGERFKVTLANGETVMVDAVLSAVGLKPRTSLALDAGIEVNRGIVVNNSLQTSAEDIFALGDCAEIDGQVQPFIMPIMHAARALASTLAGKPERVSFLPMPVAVKTPACPAVILPPKPGISGSWDVKRQPNGIKATYQDTATKVSGFALLGESISEKNAIIQLVANSP